MLTHDPGRLQDTKSLVVDRARPWHRIARRPFLDDCHSPSLTSEENCRHETNRARAHDEEVDQAGRLIRAWCIHRTAISYLRAVRGIGIQQTANAERWLSGNNSALRSLVTNSLPGR